MWKRDGFTKRFLVVGGSSEISYRIAANFLYSGWNVASQMVCPNHSPPSNPRDIYIHYTLKSLNMENQWTIQIPTPNYASEVSLIKYMFLTRYVYYILFKNRCQFEIVVHHDIGMSLIAHLQLLLVKWDETNWSEKNANVCCHGRFLALAIIYYFTFGNV